MTTPDENGDWIIERGPIDTSLEGRLVRGIEEVTSVWQFSHPEHPEANIVAPVCILSFYTRDTTTSTVVLSAGAVSSLMADLSDFLVHILGGVEAVVTDDLTEEGLTKLIDDVLNEEGNDNG